MKATDDPQAAAEAGRSLAELVDGERDRLLQRWLERVQRRYAPSSLSRPEVLDHVPELLDTIVQALRAGRCETRRASEVASIGSEHGAQRYHKGFDLDAIVREYAELRDVIFDRIEEVGLALSIPEIRVLTQCLSTATAEAVRCYTEQRAEELRRAHLRFERIANSGIVGIVEWDASGAITAANDAELRMLGYTREDLEAGRLDFRKLTPPEYREITEATVRTLKETGVVQPFEKQYFRKDGSRVDVLLSSATLDEQRERGIALAIDISEQKRSEAEIRRRAWFEQHLIGIVSHDLRNPVGAILMTAATLLRREEVDERTRKAALRIQASAERVARMINDLLDFTQARLGGGIPMTRREADLRAPLQQVVDEVRAGHPGRRIELQVDGDLVGAWDTDRIAQVIGNLLSNAAAYSPAGSPVTVRARGEPEAVEIAVHNTGAPIPAELLPQLFEPMKRGGGRIGKAGRSIGLGLFIVKHVVEAHGGRVEVRSSEGDGTLFTVRLPRRAPA